MIGILIAYYTNIIMIDDQYTEKYIDSMLSNSHV